MLIQISSITVLLLLSQIRSSPVENSDVIIHLNSVQVLFSISSFMVLVQSNR